MTTKIAKTTKTTTEIRTFLSTEDFVARLGASSDQNDVILFFYSRGDNRPYVIHMGDRGRVERVEVRVRHRDSVSEEFVEDSEEPKIARER